LIRNQEKADVRGRKEELTPYKRTRKHFRNVFRKTKKKSKKAILLKRSAITAQVLTRRGC